MNTLIRTLTKIGREASLLRAIDLPPGKHVWAVQNVEEINALSIAAMNLRRDAEEVIESHSRLTETLTEPLTVYEVVNSTMDEIWYYTNPERAMTVLASAHKSGDVATLAIKSFMWDDIKDLLIH